MGSQERPKEPPRHNPAMSIYRFRPLKVSSGRKHHGIVTKTHDAHATLDRLSVIVDDLDAAKVKARSLFEKGSTSTLAVTGKVCGGIVKNCGGRASTRMS
jgi:hypothetical protein